MNKYNVHQHIIKEALIQIGAFMKLRRVDKGLTQRKLAELLNVLPDHISRVEKGKIGYTMEFFLSWCAHLQVNHFLITKEINPYNLEALIILGLGGEE
jgi:transcriptional regulator with XRE-family HTH domain